MKRRTLIVLSGIVIFQIAVLGFELLGAIYPLWTGKEIRLQIVPQDPRSLFRGHYARLQYDLSNIDQKTIKAPARLRIGEVLYVRLEPDPEGFCRASAATLARPASGLFIRGRVEERQASDSLWRYTVRYGIEAFFVDQEHAQTLEKELRSGGVAIVKIAANGKAALENVIAAPESLSTRTQPSRSEATMLSSDLLLPEYRCRRIERSLNLSGKMDDPLWSTAEAVELADIYGKPGRFKTTVRCLYDQEFLYVGFNCQDDYVWSTIRQRNGSVWEEECIEVFLNPGNTAHQYYEINVNPLNTIFDACIITGRTEENPDVPFIGFPELDFKRMRTAVTVSGTLHKPGSALGWIVEMAIPFNELFGAQHVPPQPDDIWRVNFYRIDQPQNSEPEHYAWSRVDKVAFHLPWRFGRLLFM